MIYIISGTNRRGSRTLQVSNFLKGIYEKQGETAEVIDLCNVGLESIAGLEYSNSLPPAMQAAVEKINSADGLVVVCPEYNGSMPGALKYFIDHWKYPDSYEFRPVALVGVGLRWGGLRPVEHLQGVFGYRNAFIYPERVFISNISTALVDGQINDPFVLGLLESQTKGFLAFTRALSQAGLDANARLTKVKTSN